MTLCQKNDIIQLSLDTMSTERRYKIAPGAWACGTDVIFGGNLTADALRPIFDATMKAGRNLWDTAYVYGMGASEKTLGSSG